MICPGCGENLENDAAYCPNCGQIIVENVRNIEYAASSDNKKPVLDSENDSKTDKKKRFVLISAVALIVLIVGPLVAMGLLTDKSDKYEKNSEKEQSLEEIHMEKLELSNEIRKYYENYQLYISSANNSDTKYQPLFESFYQLTKGVYVCSKGLEDCSKDEAEIYEMQLGNYYSEMLRTFSVKKDTIEHLVSDYSPKDDDNNKELAKKVFQAHEVYKNWMNKRNAIIY